MKSKVVGLLAACVCMAVAGGAAETPVKWDLDELSKPPQVFEAGFPEKDGVKPIFYAGVPYEGKATRVFAYLAVPKVKPGEKVPGMVLVHGGLGSAFRRWAKFWCDQGYAAISMDTCGCVSGNEFGNEQTEHRRHEWAGPAGWGDFKNVAKPFADQWPYHAVAAVVKANSLIRSLPEVDPDRIGLTGVSWGGYLTCMAASVDPRFDFAAPVYGCGYLDDNSVWKDKNGENGSTAEQFAKWCTLFDPRHYLGGAKCDFLWIDGSNDFAYPLDSLQKSVMTLRTAWYRATRLNMPHGHGPYAEHPKELVDFASFRLKKAERKTYPFVRSCTEALGVVSVEWQADEDRIVKAELNWTADRGKWQTRKWTAQEMEIFEGYASAEVRLPVEATCWYVNLFTEDGKCVSGELTERTDADIKRDKAVVALSKAKLSKLELAPLPDGFAAAFDFTSSPGAVRRELHGASWVTRSYPRGFMNDDKAIAALKLDSFRTHDAPLVNSGQNIVDTHEIFPLMHLDAKDPKNYVFKPTDHFLELNFNLGMKCLYRLGTSIEHTGDWGYNTLNPTNHEQYAEVLAGIVRHYTRGWADGYRWADRITHWELFNEPDVAPCWRGTKAEFIHLYVTCLKRLKAEFPELKIGGPGFGSFFSFGRELLRACKAAGVKPDFVAWHYYGSNPMNILAQPAQVRAVAEAEGFPGLELVIDEWHYIRNNSWDGIQGASSPEAMIRAREGREGCAGIDSAVFTTQVELGFHDTPLSKSHFYGCGVEGCWGYLDRFRRPNKTYYAMQAMGELMASCKERAMTRTAGRTFGAFGAWTSDRRGASLIVSDFRGTATELKVSVKGLPDEVTPQVRILDDRNDLVAWDGFSWRDGVLTLRKSEPGSVIFAIDFRPSVVKAEQAVAQGGLEVRLARSNWLAGEDVQAVLREQPAGKDATNYVLRLEKRALGDRSLEVEYALPFPPSAGSLAWHHDLRTSQEASSADGQLRNASKQPVGSGWLSYWPFGAVTGKDGSGRALALDPDAPAFYNIYLDARTRRLVLHFDIALTDELPTAEVRFTSYPVGGKSPFRSALAGYTTRYPRAFESRAREHGLWMPFSKISEVKGWEDFGFKFKEGDKEPDWDKAHGIHTFYYTEPSTWWQHMEGPTNGYNLAIAAEVAKLNDPDPRAKAWESSVFHDRDGKPVGFIKDMPWCRGVVWNYNDAPGIAGKTTGWKVKMSHPPRCEYIDSAEMYVTVPLDFNRAHFGGMRTPLVWDSETGRPAVFKGLIGYEYVRAAAERAHGAGCLTMANGTPMEWFWLAPNLDVLGTEWDWQDWRDGHRVWTPPSDTELMYRRALCGKKPFCFLMNTDFALLTPERTRRYFDRCLAYGAFPGFFSIDAATAPYFTRPELYERDRPLFKKYVPLVKTISEAGWVPENTLLEVSDSRVVSEQFGARHVTLFNPLDRALTLKLRFPKGRSVRELLSGEDLSPSGDWIERTLGPERACLFVVDQQR